jgi:diphthine synthase
VSELAFVGLGLADERGLSARAWDALRSADEVFAEEYTATAPEGTIDRIGREVHRRVQRLDRAELESERPLLEALDRSRKVVLLVVGDPFVATTHVALRLAAERAGHAWSYVPNASVLTAAAGFLGLQHYRFGRTVSIPFREPGFAPRSPLEQIGTNRGMGLHSLVLLDLRPAEGRFLSAAEALRFLRETDPEAAILPRDVLVAVGARIGRDDAAGWFGPLEELAGAEFGPPPHVVAVPAADLHFEEAAALERFRVSPARLGV